MMRLFEDETDTLISRIIRSIGEPVYLPNPVRSINFKPIPYTGLNDMIIN